MSVGKHSYGHPSLSRSRVCAAVASARIAGVSYAPLLRKVSSAQNSWGSTADSAGIIKYKGLYANRLAEQVERLARHAWEGELWEKAVAYLRQAGAKAIVGSANREAVAHVERALVALQHFPESRTTMEQAIDVRCAANSGGHASSGRTCET